MNDISSFVKEKKRVEKFYAVLDARMQHRETLLNGTLSFICMRFQISCNFNSFQPFCGIPSHLARFINFEKASRLTSPNNTFNSVYL